MTDDLIARLRYDCDEMFDPICGEAADALEAKNKRIAELEAQVKGAFQSSLERSRLAEAQDARIAELENLLKPFARLNANWFGDKMPLQIKSIPVEPLPVLYASKYFAEPKE